MTFIYANKTFLSMEESSLEVLLSGILLLVLLGGASVVYFTLRLGISPVPTSPRVKATILQCLPQPIEGQIVELGCGWGSLLKPLAIRYPACRLVGYERSWLPFWVSRWRMRAYSKAEVLCEDFFQAELGQASLVVAYLFHACMEELAAKLKRELRPGTWVLVHTFRLPGWKPVRELECQDLYRTRVYLYQVL